MFEWLEFTGLASVEILVLPDRLKATLTLSSFGILRFADGFAASQTKEVRRLVF
jgi:hypothetical protein